MRPSGASSCSPNTRSATSGSGSSGTESSTWSRPTPVQGRAPLRATIDDGCGATAYDASFEDEDGFAGPDETDWSDDDADEPSADASSDDDSDGSGDEESCDFEDLEEGVVLTQAQFEVRDGTTHLVGVEIA